MNWSVVLPDGSRGYIKYRWGHIGLFKIDERAGCFRDGIVEEKIGDDYSGTLPLDEAISWLQKQGFEVVNNVDEEDTEAWKEEESLRKFIFGE